MLVSDGVTCAEDAHGVELGLPGVERALAGVERTLASGADAEALADAVLAAVTRHAAGHVEDDLVVAVIRRL